MVEKVLPLRECALSTAGGGTKILSKSYPVYLAIPPKKGGCK